MAWTPTRPARSRSDKGLRLVGLSQVYPFNSWDDERDEAVQSLIATAKAAGAETISLIPRNDGTGAWQWRASGAICGSR